MEPGRGEKEYMPDPTLRRQQPEEQPRHPLHRHPHEPRDPRAQFAEQPEHSAKLTELTALLEKEMQRSGDTGVLKVANPKPADWSPAATTGNRKAKQ